MNIIISLLAIVFLVLSVMVISKVLSLTKNLDRNSEEVSGSYADAFNGFNAKMMLAFFVVGMFLAAWSFIAWKDEMILGVASEHGVKTDSMFWLSMAMATAAFFVTNAFLFYFAFKYRYKPGKTATYYPVNHTLEYVWTATPAVFMAVMVFFGWKLWSDITAQAPQDAVVIEVMGKQFGWYVRYTGVDGKLGNYNYKLTVDGKNDHGIDLSDENSFDDFSLAELHVPKGKPVLLKIRARDVLHSVFLPYQRVKMDAVPGMPTKFWFVPTKSTEEMRYELGKSNFNYFLTCTEICGRGHFGMKIPMFVHEEEEFNTWLAAQPTWISNNKGFLTKVPEKLKAKANKAAGVEEVVEEAETTTAPAASTSLK